MKYHICNCMNQINDEENTHAPDIILIFILDVWVLKMDQM
jgi:hypothetical protein